MSTRFKGAQVGGMLDFGDKEIYQRRRHLHRRRQRGRERGLGRLQGRREEHRPRWLGLVRPAPRGRPRRLRQAPARRSTNDTRFKLAAIPESVYFENQSRSSIFLKGAGTLIAVLLTFGAMFAAANTMFAAVSARTREIGTMRALGFSQFDILISFLGESLILCGLGGLLGLLATLPLNALTYETSDFNSFASITVAFRFGPLVMAVALVMTLAMGLFGGMFPALRAVRLDVISALREL